MTNPDDLEPVTRFDDPEQLAIDSLRDAGELGPPPVAYCTGYVTAWRDAMGLARRIVDAIADDGTEEPQ
ncbi:hypothetical protein CS006_10490 [Bifidobacterium primatium]|uniref:Uncharacterized protein n=2 Tax=Bifidobacterium TaxID=1678 RepID=A0A2M9H6E1_9BIFI|nr:MULTISPECIES: hypothetical protein [Bifidobacterium]NEG95991.1 hypothetical protein [Bifidobacterium sp. SMB2]NEH12456.1 hypothetical protein [Bifidobacterium saimiriisciurei]PJM72355.1 hypothetical protein CS006_10490 [Bifidobacterium primatium]